MNYGDVMNDLRKSNYYFNKILYKNILSLKTIVDCKKENNEMLKYYYKQKTKKKLYMLVKNIYLREIINNLKINFIYCDI
jgi:hypothetical protein